MNNHLRVHVGRRRRAIDRLQSLTTGAVVVGVAGTVGFGVLAAATFTGKSTAQAATTDETQPPTSQPQTGSGTSRNQGTGNAAAPTPGALGATPTPTPTPRPTRTPRPHAATGGSG
jgi:cytoskeletal protein RodZ